MRRTPWSTNLKPKHSRIMTIDNINTLAPAQLHAQMEGLKAQGFDFLVNLIGMDWGEDGGLGVVYELENTTTHQRT